MNLDNLSDYQREELDDFVKRNNDVVLRISTGQPWFYWHPASKYAIVGMFHTGLRDKQLILFHIHPKSWTRQQLIDDHYNNKIRPIAEPLALTDYYKRKALEDLVSS